MSYIQKASGSNVLEWGSITGDIENQTDLAPYIEELMPTPAGNNTEIQFNDDGEFGSSSNIRTGNLFLNPNTVPSGAGTRLMWIPAKSAFRCGSVTGTNWNLVNIHDNSVAFGLNTRAGLGATASGNSAVASGNYSFAVGNNTNSSGTESFAFGRDSVASGYRATAGGFQSVASGQYSFSLGSNCVASGNYAIALGWASKATNTSAFAVNNNCTATGMHSFACGVTSVASGQGSFAHSGNASGYGSIAMGYTSNARGAYSISFGQHTDARINGSLAFSSGRINGNRIDLSTYFSDNQNIKCIAHYVSEPYDYGILSVFGAEWQGQEDTVAHVKATVVGKSESYKASMVVEMLVSISSSGMGDIISQSIVFSNDVSGIFDYWEFWFDDNELKFYYDSGVDETSCAVILFDVTENIFKASTSSS